MFGVKKKISLNLEEDILKKLDREADLKYSGYFKRKQRSRTIEGILRAYFKYKEKEK